MDRAIPRTAGARDAADPAYHYDLPPELIAQEPPRRRADSQLLVVRRGGRPDGIRPFGDLPDLLDPGDLLVVNDSRVLPARLWTRRADTGGRVELLLLRPVDQPPGAWQAMARPTRRLRTGQLLDLLATADGAATGDRLEIVAGPAATEVTVRAPDGTDLATLAAAHGDAPLPPYIRRDQDARDAARRRAQDRERYQTVYARSDAAGAGSVAAPTAGLHFDRAQLARLDGRGIGVAPVTLHVGPGTFRPPTPAQIAAGRLHAETFELPAATAAAVTACRARGGRVIAVGTTSLRVLETVALLDLPATPADDRPRRFAIGDEGKLAPVCEGVVEPTPRGWRVRGSTRLFIQPPRPVRAADALLTNFHLPGSSLLRLVAAFLGEADWREAYGLAVASRLRFFSYGDAMLILPAGRMGP